MTITTKSEHPSGQRQLQGHTALVTVDLDAIRHNFLMIKERREAAQGSQACPEIEAKYGIRMPSALAVVKADAYGHGHVEVSAHLCRTAGAEAFASGNVEEACALRAGLAAQGLFPEIISLLGPVTLEDWEMSARYSIISVLHSKAQLDPLKGAKLPGPDPELFPANAKRPVLPVVIKCNTGMARLGFGEADLPEVLERISECAAALEKDGRPGIVPVMSITHLAKGDAPDGPDQVVKQAKLFARMLEILRKQGPIAASMCNSAGSLQADLVDPIIGPHVCRPGIVLYGYSPLDGTPQEERGRGFRHAMTVGTPIIAMRTLLPGESIGYGHTWTAKEKTQVAIIAAGYADGFSRGLSNKGQVCIHGVRAHILGRVSMQMTAINLNPLEAKGIAPKLGDTAYIIGGSGEGALTADDLARDWGTICYEPMCVLGVNIRKFVGQ